MRKLIAIIVAIIYITVTSGIVINIHYCMGEMSDVAFGTVDVNQCGTCGMDNDGCCHDDLQVVRLTEAHQAAPSLSAFFTINAYQQEQILSADILDELPAKWVNVSQVHTPPKVFDRNVLYRVFRV